MITKAQAQAAIEQTTTVTVLDSPQVKSGRILETSALKGEADDGTVLALIETVGGHREWFDLLDLQIPTTGIAHAAIELTKLRSLTILQLVDLLASTALDSMAPDGGQQECADIRAEIERRLATIYKQGSIGGQIRSLIGPDVA